MSLSRALDLWIDVTGVDPSKTSFRLGDLDVLSMHGVLREALELDDTEITGKLIFEYLVSNYFKERSFSIDELLTEPEKVSKYLQKSRELLSYLRNEELLSIGKAFSDKMMKAVRSYGAHDDTVLADLKDPHILAVLRRDALRSLKSLRINQFLSGAHESADFQPVYGKFVYRWWNINSMLKMMTRMPSGITLNLICHPTDPCRSYFAFVIRNGGNLFVFTDKENTPHPMAEDLYRRMDKVLAARAQRNWFPYELMGLSYNDDGDPIIINSDARTLVAYQSELHPVKAISDLQSSTILWLTMMFDLIVQKFWREGYKAPQLSYTAEMIKVEDPLIAAARDASLPVTDYEPPSLPPLMRSDVHSDSVDAAALGKTGFGANSWMEERYGQQVSDEVLNIIRPAGAALRLEVFPQEQSVVVDTAKHSERHLSLLAEERNKTSFKLDFLDATSFGTREELAADRVFVARSNYAKSINYLAAKEFDQRKKEIQDWVRERITQNLESLYPLLAKEEVLLPCVKFDDSPERGATTWRGMSQGVYKRAFVRRTALTGENEWQKQYIYSEMQNGSVTFLGAGYKENAPTCFHTNAPSFCMAKIIPETTVDLAFLCGCEVSELPDVLQHWTLFKRFVGNPILDRVDPMEWECDNPWATLEFQAIFFFSKRAINALEKKYGGIQAKLPINKLDNQ